MPNGARVKATLTLFDTRLLAPAGAGKLKDLGNLIGLPKLDVPDVVNEKGETVPGIDEDGPRPRPATRSSSLPTPSGTPKSRSPICAASPSSPRAGA